MQILVEEILPDMHGISTDFIAEEPLKSLRRRDVKIADFGCLVEGKDGAAKI